MLPGSVWNREGQELAIWGGTICLVASTTWAGCHIVCDICTKSRPVEITLDEGNCLVYTPMPCKGGIMAGTYDLQLACWV